jgi:hypothetical protein
VRCPRCGNENSDQNRFCGMCGATLLSAPEPVAKQAQPVASASSATPAAQPAASRPQSVESPRSAAPLADDAPGISGPSFLGLNDPPTRKRGSLSIDPREAASSRNLNYLLDDDDEPKNSGAGKFLVILVALALAVGLGYLRWKNHGFGWLNPTSKPSAAAQNTDDTNSPAPAASDSQPSAASPSITPAPVQPNSSAAPNANPPAAATPTATPSTPPTTSPAAPATTDTPKPADNTTPPAATTDKPASAANDSATAAKQTSSDDSDADTSNQPKPTADQPPPKPAAAKPIDPVVEAQKYLYGRGGVAQNCDRGLRMLKGPANQGNTKAMVEMGALYSAGLCTPHDLPTAYRWFALVLRKDPDNQAVQADLQKLWGEMTQPERKLAIQLTQ